MNVHLCWNFRLFGVIMRPLLQFLKNTSVKGIPRIFRTKSYFLRTIWIVSVIIFSCIAAYQVYSLIFGYLERATIVSLNEFQGDLTGTKSETVRLPDITFCNMNPFAVDTSKTTDILSLESYHRWVLEVTECENCSQELQKSLRELRMALHTTDGYRIQIGKRNATRISHTEDQFLASCSVEILFGMVPRILPCKSIVTVQRYFNPVYYNCYIIQIPPATPTEIYNGVIVVLHLNNYLDIINQQQYLDTHYNPGQISGALMAFNPQTQDPELLKSGINLPSGFFVSAQLSLVHQKRLPHPYGKCQPVDDITGTYQQMACVSTCLQRHVMNQCGCIDYTGYHYIVFHLIEFYSNLLPCLSVNHGKKLLVDQWLCRKKTYLNHTTRCVDSCPPLCEEVIYDYDVSILHFTLGPFAVSCLE